MGVWPGVGPVVLYVVSVLVPQLPTAQCHRSETLMPDSAIEPLFDSVRHQCDIRGCLGVAEWRVLGTDEHIGFCRRHRDLIEDEGLDLIDE
jgi:hypothetical protein